MKKKWASLIFAACLLFAAVPVVGAEESVHLNYNGSNVSDLSAHFMNDGVYVSVDNFAKYYGAKVEFDEASGVLKLNGKEVSTTYGSTENVNGILTASIRAMAEAIGEKHFEIGWDAASSTVNVAILPPGTIKLSPVLPQMGAHWANPKDMPMGPIYGVYNGKLVFFEYMPAKSLDKTVHDVPGNLVPIPAKIDHFDIDWNPQGHEGYEVPHYDMHLYFISREEQNMIPAEKVNPTDDKGHAAH